MNNQTQQTSQARINHALTTFNSYGISALMLLEHLPDPNTTAPTNRCANKVAMIKMAKSLTKGKLPARKNMKLQDLVYIIEVNFNSQTVALLVLTRPIETQEVENLSFSVLPRRATTSNPKKKERVAAFA